MYWDYAATTPVKPEVFEAMKPYLTDKWYNPSTIYEPGMQVRRDIEAAREIVAKSINADPEEIYFTSGGSEANSWVLNMYGINSGWVLTSNIEHPSIAHSGKNLELSKVNNKGVLIPNWVVDEMEDVGLVSVQMANNELGTIQPVSMISRLSHANHWSFHTDAVQAYGKIPIDVKEMKIDMLSASGHKIGGPKGIGFLYVNKRVLPVPMIYGSQETHMRGGTENVAGIMGLAKAVELIDYSEQDKCRELFKRAYDLARDVGKVNGQEMYGRLYNIINITIDAPIDGNMLLGMLHDKGQYVSAGSACQAYSPEPSHVLKAIGLSDEEAMRSIRISFSGNERLEDVDRLFEDIKECIQFLKGWRF